MKGYLDTSEEVLKKLNTKRTGLSAEEAAGRLMADGKNKLKEAKPVPLWRRFLSQLADPMIIILIAAAVVSGMTAVYDHYYDRRSHQCGAGSGAGEQG